MLPLDESDRSSMIITSSSEISSSITTSTTTPNKKSLPTTKTATASSASTAVTAEQPTTAASGMFALVLDQLRTELAEERRKRELLEARHRQLAVHLYYVVDEQIRGVQAMKKLIKSVREGKEDQVNEMIAVMKRMKTAWGKTRPRSLVVKKYPKK